MKFPSSDIVHVKKYQQDSLKEAAFKILLDSSELFKFLHPKDINHSESQNQSQHGWCWKRPLEIT